MVDFTKTGNVRIEQLRHEINEAASQLGVSFPSNTIVWIPENEVVRFQNATDGIDAQVDVEALVTQYSTQVQNIIDNHVPTNEYFEHEKEEAYEQNLSAVLQQVKDAVVALEGVSITDMTTAQLKTLLLALAYKARAIDSTNLTIRHPKDWIR